MMFVLLTITAIDEDVIEEYEHKFSQVFGKYCVHEFLECGRSVTQAKRHDTIFIMPQMGGK
jgi:hypothetical protein